jgi:hypothetical protein
VCAAASTPVASAAATLAAITVAAAPSAPLTESTRTSLFTRAGYVHLDLSVIQGKAIEHANGILTLALGAHLHKSETL